MLPSPESSVFGFLSFHIPCLPPDCSLPVPCALQTFPLSHELRAYLRVFFNSQIVGPDPSEGQGGRASVSA